MNVYQDIEPTVQRVLDGLFPELDAAEPRWDGVVEEVRARKRRRLILDKRVARITAVAIAALLAVAIPSSLIRNQKLGASDAAAQLLKRTAQRAAAIPTARAGTYRYEKVKVLEAGISLQMPHPHTVLVPRIRETWTAADGSGRRRETTGQPLFPSEQDHRRWLAAGDELPSAGKTSEERYGPRAYLAEDARLPTEVDALSAALRERARKLEPPLSAGLVIEVGDLLASPATTPALRAGLYKVLARSDGVELDGTTTDSIGRTGVAISVPAGYSNDAKDLREVLIFDPQSSTVLERRTVLVKPVAWTGATPPATIGSTTYLASGNVDSTASTGS